MDVTALVSEKSRRRIRSSMALWPWGMLILILSLSGEHGVGALNFALNGFNQSDVYIVPDSPWLVNTTSDYRPFYLPNPTSASDYSVAGRFLYPNLVEMIDPGTTTVKSWSTTFIYQIQIETGFVNTGPGMAFIMVPDNITIGAPNDYMGVMTVNTTKTAKNYESDNHTFAVELDTKRNREFGDPNNNHIGVDLASMNSSGYTCKPTFDLASSSTEQLQQIWIHYYQENSRLEIYVGLYGQPKPAAPQGAWDGMDLSLLKENMYVGFAGAAGWGSGNLNVIYAWSFSNDGQLAPEIFPAPLAPLPGGLVPPSTQPPQPSFSPPPKSPPLAPTPLYTPARPPNTSPPPVRASPPPLIATPGNSNNSRSSSAGKIKGIVIGSLVGTGVFALIAIIVFLVVSLRFFISHTGGENQEGKNFPLRLYDEMTKSWKLRLFIRVFMDRRKLRVGQSFPRQILKELERTQVGLALVTPGFFTRKWPMVELVNIVESSERPNSTMRRVIPLFYRMKADEVRKNLIPGGEWEKAWRIMSTHGDHPLSVERCTNAVKKLCTITGINYKYNDLGHDKEYIKEILKCIGEILYEEISGKRSGSEMELGRIGLGEVLIA